MRRRGLDFGVKAKLLSSIRKLERLESDYPWFNLGDTQIAFGHAEDSVRTNGRERLTSFLDCIDAFEKELTPDLERVSRNITLSFGVIQKARDAFYSKYMRCPKCRGKHGLKVKGNWEDCCNCEGTGYVRK